MLVHLCADEVLAIPGELTHIVTKAKQHCIALGTASLTYNVVNRLTSHQECSNWQCSC